MLNYLDRTLLSVASPLMAKDMSIGPVLMGFILSAFSWSYAAAQLPGGALLDRFGTRVTYAVSLIAWSIFTACQGLAFNVASLFGARLAMGAAEAPCFPANSRILVSWFPQRERARANATYSIGMYFGIAFLSPLLYWVTERFGWRHLFVGAGAVGVIFGLIWWRLYREPRESNWANQAEIDQTAAAGGIDLNLDKAPFSWSDIGWLLKQRQIVGASIGQFATNSTLVFFLTWFPTYLVKERHMAFIKVGFFASLPFIAASVGVVVGGILSDYLLKKTGSLTIGRKTPVVMGLLLSSLIVTAAFVSDNTVVIVVMSIAFFGQGLSNLGWTLISEVAPRRLIGVTGGLFNFCTNLAGIITPIVIGFAVAKTGSFFGGLAYIGVMALLGAFSYVFVLGEVKRVGEDRVSAA
ncbi:MAG: transporter, family, D-galactonate transporter [Caulobacteraceae bacterium]|nr:transporter, family, D-galactonate transporter [Caulobacteraceae bacterium]